MFNILICEENPVYRTVINEIMESILFNTDIDGCVLACAGNEEVIYETIRTKQIHGVFMDIEMQSGDNGLEIARKIKANNPEIYIVFISKKTQYLREALKINAFDFIEKPIKPGEFEECIYRLIQEIERKNRDPLQSITLKTGSTVVFVRKQQIIFVEKDHNRALVHTTTGVHKVYQTLTRLESLLKDAGIVRVHKGYLVNVQKIKKARLDTLELYLEGEHRCYFSPHHKKKLGL